MIQIRRFRYLDWVNLVKVRDGLQVVKENLNPYSRDWEHIDELLYEISEEIDIRYKKEVASEQLVK